MHGTLYKMKIPSVIRVCKSDVMSSMPQYVDIESQLFMASTVFVADPCMDTDEQRLAVNERFDDN